MANRDKAVCSSPASTENARAELATSSMVERSEKVVYTIVSRGSRNSKQVMICLVNMLHLLMDQKLRGGLVMTRYLLHGRDGGKEAAAGTVFIILGSDGRILSDYQFADDVQT